MKYPIHQIRYLLITLSVLWLAACSELPRHWDPQGYTVKRGDTLYSIAWRYEKDFRQVAQWNDIPPPYAIYPGQRLLMQASNQDGTLSKEGRPQVLTDPVTGKTRVNETPQQIRQSVSSPDPTPNRAKKRMVVVQKLDTLYAIATREGLSHHQLARWNRLRPPYTLQPGKKLRLSPPNAALGGSMAAQADKSGGALVSTLAPRHIKSKVLSGKAKSQRAKYKAPSLPLRIDKWQWPAAGRVLQTFRANDTARKGIEITGKLGQAVKAAASGTVVYSGNGLINYGNLVIIKHSHSFLSAYAYNRSLLVKEGESVKQGQSIARMGKANSAKAQLHFEIRRNGKPVNPLHYLPKK